MQKDGITDFKFIGKDESTTNDFYKTSVLAHFTALSSCGAGAELQYSDGVAGREGEKEAIMEGIRRS